MIEENEIKQIKELIEELLHKMTVVPFNIEITPSFTGNKVPPGNNKEIIGTEGERRDVVGVNITVEEPQILIGQNGQTLFELQRLLKMILHKRLQKNFYLELDINDYKKKKIEYLENLAEDAANEVVFTKKEKNLSAMPAYERRVVHAKLAQRQDVATESQGDGEYRYIIIKPT